MVPDDDDLLTADPPEDGPPEDDTSDDDDWKTKLYFFDGSGGCMFCQSHTGYYESDAGAHEGCDCPVDPPVEAHATRPWQPPPCTLERRWRLASSRPDTTTTVDKVDTCEDDEDTTVSFPLPPDSGDPPPPFTRPSRVAEPSQGFGAGKRFDVQINWSITEQTYECDLFLVCPDKEPVRQATSVDSEIVRTVTGHGGLWITVNDCP